MKKQTVKRRFFLSNAQMILTTLLVILAINAAAIKAYSEYIEHVTESPVGSAADEEELEALLKEYTIRKNEFILLLFADGCLCAAALVLVSGVFTRKLARHIMEPLDALADGAQRIRNNDLTQEIAYTGDTEFENVCHAFDGMQKAILAGQEKNRAYEKARTEMIAGISHDLRTPLTAARGAIKGVLDGVAAAPEQQRRFLETAYRRTGEMERLLERLFYLSKLETGNMPLELETVDLWEFIQNYVQKNSRFWKMSRQNSLRPKQEARGAYLPTRSSFKGFLTIFWKTAKGTPM